MTRAADDFALIINVLQRQDEHMRVFWGDERGVSMQAFHRLFTPRPLRELVAEGWTRFQTWPEGRIFELAGPYIMQVGIRNTENIEQWEDYPCTPIPTPQDMGA